MLQQTNNTNPMIDTTRAPLPLTGGPGGFPIVCVVTGEAGVGTVELTVAVGAGTVELTVAEGAVTVAEGAGTVELTGGTITVTGAGLVVLTTGMMERVLFVPEGKVKTVMLNNI